MYLITDCNNVFLSNAGSRKYSLDEFYHYISVSSKHIFRNIIDHQQTIYGYQKLYKSLKNYYFFQSEQQKHEETSVIKEYAKDQKALLRCLKASIVKIPHSRKGNDVI